MSSNGSIALWPWTKGARRAAGNSGRNQLWTALLFLLPAAAAVVVIRLWPALSALHASLWDTRREVYNVLNYSYIFTDQVFLGSLRTTLLFSLIINPLQIGLALALALLLHAKLPAVGLWRTLIVLPIAIPQSVSAVVWGIAYRPDGLLNSALATIGVDPQRFLTSPEQALPSIIVLLSWVGVGYWMTFLIAGLKDIPASLYEAARIDGLNSWQQFWYVTLPQLRRPLTFVLIAATTANFLIFAPVQILTSGGPQQTTNLIMNEIYVRAFQTGDIGAASAATVVLVSVVLFVVAIQFRIMSRMGGGDE